MQITFHCTHLVIAAMFVLQRSIEIPWSIGAKFPHHSFKEVFDNFAINTASLAVPPGCRLAKVAGITNYASLG